MEMQYHEPLGFQPGYTGNHALFKI